MKIKKMTEENKETLLKQLQLFYEQKQVKAIRKK